MAYGVGRRGGGRFLPPSRVSQSAPQHAAVLSAVVQALLAAHAAQAGGFHGSPGAGSFGVQPQGMRGPMDVGGQTYGSGVESGLNLGPQFVAPPVGHVNPAPPQYVPPAGAGGFQSASPGLAALAAVLSRGGGHAF